MNTLPLSFGKIFNVSVDELVDPDRVSFWRDQMYQNKFLVFKGLVNLSKDQLWDIHKVFGTPWTDVEYKDSFEVPSCDTPGKYITTYSNVNTKTRIGDKSLPWHHDIPWHREKRYPIRSLYPTKLDGESVPTSFVNCDVIWNRIPKEEWNKLAEADIRLQYWYNASKGILNTPSKVVPLVEQHFHTKKYSLLLNSFGPNNGSWKHGTSQTGAWIIDCWSRSTHLGLDYLNYLHEIVCTEDNIYDHEWELGDLVLFDNSSGVMHKRDHISNPSTVREFWRMNVKHYWQK